ncbi:SpoIID/LytB domain-containing protein [Anabaena sp. FACHB-709]|uniref:Amidase enhancer n=2 Tax=Nostocaceae TaxID=1162 RepID=A0A1Z4KLC0_ANAVA|nr:MULTISPECIES: SpoIID/LytB domain-containing protein [Nostocaceae]BAY69771.1 amidase enhancer [Trichormus variabilis NIES-23]HBW33284.1 SpoIID/LytB domain-containing protein [Nostoc sp. UBA8866]MBD2172859.1 SpoIID/LytB domain-containing protein [Anabaena cylindrica FACHB-318]MBD2264516.1 SpoIID/LytB domain-containing protein [Anabaena sp. FACHB-709]MBD2273788.1 SpoIID/LytB domain-containing protein [Nostoc sp. PCC 7120 = FACHB-418]
MRQNHHFIKQLPQAERQSTEGKNLIAVKHPFWRFSYTVLMTFCLLGLTGASATEDKLKDLELKIGIVQRFGEESTAKLQLEPTTGDRLKLKFAEGNKERVLLTDKPVKLETVMQALPKPAIAEVVVLGTYRTYETAEYSAENWRKQGIEVEIAQPDRWQVWAKRDVYNTPLLRRLLFQNIKAASNNLAYIDTKVLPKVPKISWTVNGTSYTPNHVEVSTVKNLIRLKKGEKLNTSRLYSGRINFQPNAYGTYTLVNQVSLETYLRGVVPHEIGTNAPTAAVEAQAILARTYALRNLRRFAIDNYQLCANTHCQVYYGLGGTDTRIDKAIAATRGMVLTYNNELIDALYSSTTGGITASFSDVWNGEDRPYLRPVVDAPNSVWDFSKQNLKDERNFQRFITLQQGFNESSWDVFRWYKETPLNEIVKDLQKFLRAKNSPYAKFQTIQAMAITNRSKSGRILELAVKTDIGIFTLHKDEVRSAFAAPRSTLFYIVPLNKGKEELWGYAFIGGGLGHGVGLSQTGAQTLAKLGWSSNKILQFYYPGTQLQSLNEEIKF